MPNGAKGRPGHGASVLTSVSIDVREEPAVVERLKLGRRNSVLVNPAIVASKRLPASRGDPASIG